MTSLHNRAATCEVKKFNEIFTPEGLIWARILKDYSGSVSDQASKFSNFTVAIKTKDPEPHPKPDPH